MPADNDLHKAAGKGDVEQLKSLVDLTQFDDTPLTVNDLGAGERRPLHRAAGAGHYDCCEFLVDAGAEIDAKDKSGRTALHFASIGGHSTIIQLLLNKGADILAVTQTKMTPLHGAVDASKLEAIKVLLETVQKDDDKRKAMTNAKNGDDKTPFEIAKAAKNKAVVDVLKEMGDENAQSAACVIS